MVTFSATPPGICECGGVSCEGPGQWPLWRSTRFPVTSLTFLSVILAALPSMIWSALYILLYPAISDKLLGK